MIGELVVTPWDVAFQEAAPDNVANQFRQSIQLPAFNMFSTFAVITPIRVAGTVTVSLRFGFADPVPLATPGRGINFPALGAGGPGDFDFAAEGYGVAAAAPNVPGNELAILPPVCSIYITTTLGVNLTYQVLYTCIGIK